MAASTTDTERPEALTLKQLAEVLIKHFGHHEGLFDASFEFKIGAGAVKANEEEEPLPGAIMAIGGVGLIKTEKINAHTVDAAISNPLRKTKPKVVASR